MSHVLELDVAEHRQLDHPILPLFYERWSPRAMSGEPLETGELMPLFEAARWAPSSYNRQPWRFIYARRETSDWPDFFELLGDFNRAWAKNAGILAIIVSRCLTDSGNDIPTHSFDTGAAWQNLALQGRVSGLVVHGMAGFDYDAARSLLDLGDDYAVEAMVAIGKPGRREDLQEDLEAKESPSDRVPSAEIAFEGRGSWKANQD